MSDGPSGPRSGDMPSPPGSLGLAVRRPASWRGWSANRPTQRMTWPSACGSRTGRGGGGSATSIVGWRPASPRDWMPAPGSSRASRDGPESLMDAGSGRCWWSCPSPLTMRHLTPRRRHRTSPDQRHLRPHHVAGCGDDHQASCVDGSARDAAPSRHRRCHPRHPRHPRHRRRRRHRRQLSGSCACPPRRCGSGRRRRYGSSACRCRR